MLTIFFKKAYDLIITICIAYFFNKSEQSQIMEQNKIQH